MTLALKSKGSGQWGDDQESLFAIAAEEDAAEQAAIESDEAAFVASTTTPNFRTGMVAATASGEPSKAPGASHATKAQRDLLRTMIAERAGQDGLEAIRERLNKAMEGGYLTKAIFTETFTALKAIKRAEAQVATTTTTARPPKVNMYAGDCNACGRRVAEGAGFVAKGDEAKWVVWHEVCPTAFPFPEGRYAVDNDEGDLRFYHLVDGQVFVMASDEEHEIHGAAAEAIIAKIALDPLEAAKRYGVEIGACGVCGRTLTSEWRLVGIGPVCSTRGFG